MLVCRRGKVKGGELSETDARNVWRDAEWITGGMRREVSAFAKTCEDVALEPLLAHAEPSLASPRLGISPR